MTLLCVCRCLIYDTGSRNKRTKASRAIWYGTEFIKFCLLSVWFPSKEKAAYLRGYPCGEQFKAHIRSFKHSTRKRLKYYRRWLPADYNLNEGVKLYGVYRGTPHDSDKDFYREMLFRHSLPSRSMANQPSCNTSELVGSSFEGKQQDSSPKATCAEMQHRGWHFFTGGLTQADYHVHRVPQSRTGSDADSSTV